MYKNIIGLVGVAASLVGVIAAVVKGIADSKTGERDSDYKSDPDSHKYGVRMVNNHTGDEICIMDDTFDNYEDAEYYACECGGEYTEGEEVFEYANEYGEPRSEVDFEVYEIEN